jgi:hypothetical protein
LQVAHRRAFIETQKLSRADYFKRSNANGEVPPEKKTPITPDGLDALDADVVFARPWGRWLGVGCVGFFGGFSWVVRTSIGLNDTDQ